MSGIPAFATGAMVQVRERDGARGRGMVLAVWRGGPGQAAVYEVLDERSGERRLVKETALVFTPFKVREDE